MVNPVRKGGALNPTALSKKSSGLYPSQPPQGAGLSNGVKKTKNICPDCGLSSAHHIKTWTDELANQLLPSLSLPKKIEGFLDFLLEKIFISLRLIKLRDDFFPPDIQLRTTCFIREAEKRGVKFQALQGPFGYTNHFRAEIGGKIFRFEGLPIADFASKCGAQFTDCKKRTKQRLKKGGFPIAEGKDFWFWQKRKAIEFGLNVLGFPLVVKPCRGSISRHVTTDIQDIEKLKRAIHKAVIFSPSFIIEKFIPDTFPHRATVVDFDFVACVKQMPANVIGDGYSTIQELIRKKNNEPNRGKPDQKEFTLYKLVINEVTRDLLGQKNYLFETIPQKGEIVWLQKDPFLKLGGDLIETTNQVHPDNIQLFREIAKFFDIRLVGIDFLARDISNPWEYQPCAVLELNSLPCIEMHHFPSSGRPQNVAKAVVDLFFKYYL